MKNLDSILQYDKNKEIMFRKSSQGLISSMFLFFSILLAGWLNSAQAYTMMGDVNSYARDGYNITFKCQNGKVRLSFLREDLVRVHMVPAGREFPRDDLHLDENGPYAIVRYDWPGCFYGSDNIKTVNIKVPKTSKSHFIRITN